MRPRRRTLRRALRQVMLAALVLVALAACGGTEKEAKPRPLPEGDKALQPGEYRSEEFEPSLSFKVGKGWSSDPLEAADSLFIRRGETMGLGFVKPQEVYKPTKDEALQIVDAPKDLVGWFQHHPHLQTDKPEPVTVGGVEGVQFDVVVADLPEDYSSVWLRLRGHRQVEYRFSSDPRGRCQVASHRLGGRAGRDGDPRLR